MARCPMTIDLLRTLSIVDGDVAGVVNAFMADPSRGVILFGEGYEIDVAKAVADHPFAAALLAKPWAGDDLRRAAVRAAILLTSPRKA